MIVNILRCAILLVISVLFPALASAKGLVQLSENSAFETFQTLNIDQLWNSTSPEIAQGENVVVVLRRFDVEARPRLDKWIGCGWLLIGTGDVGARPVGLKIWDNATCPVITVKKIESSRKQTECFELEIGNGKIFHIFVGSDLRVMLGERYIGIIR